MSSLTLVTSCSFNPAKKVDTSNALWEEQAEKLPWFKHWDTTLVWNEPFAQWFVGGKLNASHACLDVHMNGDHKNKVALHWEGENGQKASWTYERLYQETNRLALALQKIGVKKGDIVVLYLPMIPEAAAAMLAVARLGAIHAVVFSGFSSEALQGRINDAQAKFVITATTSFRRGKNLNVQAIVDDAVKGSPSIEKVLVIARDASETITRTDKTVVYQELVNQDEKPFVKPVEMDSTDPLFILYTSGTTGKPKGIMHATGGYLTYARATFDFVFNPDEKMVYWCTADIGWITGHSYVVYAPLMHGVTMVMHEGTLDYPDAGRWWDLIERYKVTAFYTSPTALRMCIKLGDEWPEKHDLSSLKLLGTVGEPINPEVWQWYNRVIGKNNCPIVDTWWQTETGGFMISPMPKLRPITLKPGSATMPLPGIDAAVVDIDGNEVPRGTKGFLVIRKPWPGMTVGILNDPERFKEVYWSKFKGMYYPGDYAVQDADGYFWLLGRADEVVNVSGHRIGTIEVESAVVELKEFAEAAAIGVNDELRGESIVVFATLKPGFEGTQELKDKVRTKIHTSIGKFVTPKEIYFVSKLPKTRSGKIMRRLLRAVVEGKAVGDVSTLEDGASIEEIREVFKQVSGEVEKTV